MVILTSGQACSHINTRQFRNILRGHGVSSKRCCRCSHRIGRCDPLCHNGKHILHINGLGNVLIHPGIENLLSITSHGIGRHCQYRQIPKAFLVPNPGGGLIAIHHRHLTVHQDPVKGFPCQQIQGLLAIICHFCKNTIGGQQLQSQFLINLIIFHQQHSGAAQLRNGHINLILSTAGPGSSHHLITKGLHNSIMEGGMGDGFCQECVKLHTFCSPDSVIPAKSSCHNNRRDHG